MTKWIKTKEAQGNVNNKIIIIIIIIIISRYVYAWYLQLYTRNKPCFLGT
jgi:hypothetical protein